jgi:hypothetical protein
MFALLLCLFSLIASEHKLLYAAVVLHPIPPWRTLKLKRQPRATDVVALALTRHEFINGGEVACGYAGDVCVGFRPRHLR